MLSLPTRLWRLKEFLDAVRLSVWIKEVVGITFLFDDSAEAAPCDGGARCIVVSSVGFIYNLFNDIGDKSVLIYKKQNILIKDMKLDLKRFI